MVRRCVTTLRLRSDRFTVCLARLAADFVLAIIENLKSWTCTLASASRLSTPKPFEIQKLSHSQTDAVHYLCPRGSDATNVCPSRPSLFVVERQEHHPFAFAGRRAYRRKL